MIDRNSYEPLYVQIRKDIEEQILSGIIKIGDKLMSETEMLRYYNVGRVTIRNALSPLVSSGCLKKEHGLGTFCVALPRKEARKNVDVFLNMGDTYFAPYFLAGISRILNSKDCNLLLHDTMDSMDNIAKLLRQTIENGTNGIIIQPYTGVERVTEDCLNALQYCLNENIPLVTIDGKFRGIDTTCLMNNDNLGGEIATKYVIDKGHKKILGLFRNQYKDSEFRAAGYATAMKAAGLQQFVLDADQVSFDEVLDLIKKEKLTAIVCYNDYLAVECYHYFAEKGIHIADDISIVGYDDTELSISSLPRITTITHPKDTMGEKAAEVIINMMAGNQDKQYRHIFTPGLVERDSVRDLT